MSNWYLSPPATLKSRPGLRYGFRRKRSEANPSSRIEYLFDAVGKTPMHVEIGTTGSPAFGAGDTWQQLCQAIATPVMLNNDGTEAYELDRNDQTKKADGSPSDISNPDFAGNAMVRFAGFPWVHRSRDDTYDYVIFSDVRCDESYHAYAHTNEKGQLAPAFYWGMFKGSLVKGSLRSLADQKAMNHKTRREEVDLARANGPGYDTIYKSGWDYIADLLTLLCKSDNGQESFGSGRCKGDSAISTGTLKAQPGFWGNGNGLADVKALYVEGCWGNMWEGMRGFVNAKGRLKTKMTPPYNFDGTGYYDTGIVPLGTSGGYVEQALLSDEGGYVPQRITGSETTYYCDGFWFNNAQLDYAIVGGYWPDSGRVGPRDVHLYRPPEFAAHNVCSRLAYLPPEVK